MHKSKIPKRKPQQKKPTEFDPLESLRNAFLIWAPNGIGFFQGTIEVLGSERSTIKTMEGGYRVVKTSEIRLEKPV